MKTGDYVVPLNGGPAMVLAHASLLEPGKWLCERWAGARHLAEAYELEKLRPATAIEVLNVKRRE